MAIGREQDLHLPEGRLNPVPSIAVLIARLGPYHLARMRALGAKLGADRVLAVEIAAESKEYAWDRVDGEGFRRVTLFGSAYEDVRSREIGQRTFSALDREQPQAVAVDGWGFPEARAALAWCRSRNRPAVLMSESQERDAQRRWHTEWLKALLLSEVDAALVGGESHAAYLSKLGLPRDRTFKGYDAVDNDYFARGAELAREQAAAIRQRLNLPEHYFLASSRFVPKKNLGTLLAAYAQYRDLAGSAAYDLVLLGDGPEKPRVLEQRRSLGLESSVHLPGFVQYPDLPTYYGLAKAFVHASTHEQWGLVVNEAMAAGLPVIVSSVCGCADELVRDGETGYRFDPSSPKELAARMAELAASPKLQAMGEAARARVAEYGAEAFAEGMARAVTTAIGVRSRRRPRLPNPALWL